MSTQGLGSAKRFSGGGCCPWRDAVRHGSVLVAALAIEGIERFMGIADSRHGDLDSDAGRIGTDSHRSPWFNILWIAITNTMRKPSRTGR